MKALTALLSVIVSLASAFSFSAYAQCEGTLSGSVTIDGGPCVDCTVTALLEPTGSLVWPVADEVQTAGDGSYSVTLPENSVIILLVKAAGTYSNTVPTFSGSVVAWADAVSFTNTCNDVFTADVDVTMHEERTGNTKLSGRIVLSSGKMQAEDPISAIDIVVEFTGGEPIGAAVSDVNGEFEFESVEPIGVGTYTVRVNLPCVPNPQTYELAVTEQDLEIGNLDFCVDADTMLIESCNITGIGTDPDVLSFKKKAYASMDPFDGTLRIFFDGADATLTVYDMGGARVVSAMPVVSGRSVALPYLRNGLYIGEVVIGNTVQRVRFPKL